MNLPTVQQNFVTIITTTDDCEKNPKHIKSKQNHRKIRLNNLAFWMYADICDMREPQECHDNTRASEFYSGWQGLALFWVNHTLIQIGLFQVYNRQVCYFKHWTPCTSLSTSARIPTLPPWAALLMIILEPWKLVIGEKWPDRCAGGESSNKVYWPRGRSSGNTRFLCLKHKSFVRL